MASDTNPLFSDRDMEFLLYEVFDVESLCQLPAFADHSRESFEMLMGTVRRFARTTLFRTHRETDQNPPFLEQGQVVVPEVVKQMVQKITDLGLIVSTRPESVGGLSLPMSIYTACSCYLMAANASAYGYGGLTLGAAHLIEKFGTEELRKLYMTPMYEGRWSGTMALTEPQAGSSLGDITTSASLQAEGHYLIRGSKMFISGGDHQIFENIVHMVLGRMEGSPDGSSGVSLFLVPKRRLESGSLVDNDVSVGGLIHKIGWKGLPSLAMNYGERGACHGYLVGEANRGLACMFQMMNEARIMIGANGVSTASVAYQESILYAKGRTQGRALGSKQGPQLPIIQHPDVRRMLLRQKAIVEGGLSIVLQTGMYSDRAEHGNSSEERERAKDLLDLLTPVAKSFPAEKGFESNTLALQIHGGYGYSSETMPESWLREQKLNSIHEGTTGIQSLDLLGRKVMALGGRGLAAFAEEVTTAACRAQELGKRDWAKAIGGGLAELLSATQQMAALGQQGNVEGMLAHSVDYLDMFSTLAIAWQLLLRACVATEAMRRDSNKDSEFYQGKCSTCAYWFAREVPRIATLAALCRSGERSFRDIPEAAF